MGTMDRRAFLQSVGVGVLASTGPLTPWAATAAGRPNVLFVCVDDLRPQLSCYGKDFMVTPNVDRFAGRGVVFTNHFVQVPTCGASRCCLLTGQRPRTRSALGNEAFQDLPREDPGRPISIPHWFRMNGYRTTSFGKVSHSPNGRRYAKPAGRYDKDGNMIYSGPDDHEPELASSWDAVGGPTGEWGDPWSAFFGYAGGKTRRYREPKSPATQAADVPDVGYPDGLIAEAAVKRLEAAGQQRNPFFMAVGFYKPHLPFCAPKRYWDLYNREAIPLPDHPDPPKNVDLSLSLHRNGELTGRYDALSDPSEATEAETRRLRHGYFACVSYIDAQIGKVLEALDRSGKRDDTIVVIWGDHGWHLGDLYVWGKHTTFDFSLRSALLVDAPGLQHRGAGAAGLVETVDLYPTLSALAGLDIPEDLSGTDVSGVLESPASMGKDAAFGYWRRGSTLAKTVRTERYRLVEWTKPGHGVVQTELYDHSADPDETVNVAESRPGVVARLRKRLETESPELVEL